MATCLYLDTARLGQMCPEAQRADRDFARLAGEEAGSPYYDHFLRAGFYSLPPSIRSRYSGLRDWSGVASLKNRIKTALGFSAGRPLLLANRSAVLVRLACRALYRRCENVLVTDMLWPAYRAILEDECQRQRRTLTTVLLNDAILRDRMNQMELIDHVLDHYRRESCDGLFLSAVTCQGVRLPIPELVAAMRSIQRPRFVVVDGAQAVNHVPMRLANSYCDFLIAGCHKWLRAYHPMGIGICSHSATDSTVAQVPNEMTGSRDHDDPLLKFTRELENQCCQAFDETVNVAPLFTTAASVGRIWHSPVGRVDEFDLQVANADRVAAATHSTGWQPVRPDVSLRSGILLIRAKRTDTRSASPDALRFALRRFGIALSAYVGGLLRMSFLADPLTPRRLNRLRFALRQCA